MQLREVRNTGAFELLILTNMSKLWKESRTTLFLYVFCKKETPHVSLSYLLNVEMKQEMKTLEDRNCLRSAKPLRSSNQNQQNC